jgi:hypothetical protein
VATDTEVMADTVMAATDTDMASVDSVMEEVMVGMVDMEDMVMESGDSEEVMVDIMVN